MYKQTLLAASLLLLGAHEGYSQNWKPNKWIRRATCRKYVYNEASLIKAIEQANKSEKPTRIHFKRHARIKLNAPLIYTGTQPITLVGEGSIIDGSQAGTFTLDNDLTAVTKDGTLVFNTSADVTLNNIHITNSATRGLVINIPADTQKDEVAVTLTKVGITNSALYGLHIDDNSDEFDDGTAGSDAGINLTISSSIFEYNGTGALDFDGLRVDERQKGSITATITDSIINNNGGDGIELDEAGTGDVICTIKGSSISKNGFYNEEDLDDGLDIDEADEGSITSYFIDTEVVENKDEGLDLDEAGEGDAEITVFNCNVSKNTDEGIKVDEEDEGDISAFLTLVEANENGDDGIQLTELEEGKIKAAFQSVTALSNAKYGIKAEQWFDEDEDQPVEDAGAMITNNIELNQNGKGDDISVNNIKLN